MFSRAAKSIVKTIGQRKYHAGEENIKLAVIGGAGEIGRSLSQMLKQTSKLNVLALYDVSALSKKFTTPVRLNVFSDLSASSNTSNSRMLTMLEKSRSSKGDYRIDNVHAPGSPNRASLISQEKATEELVDRLLQLPVAEECVTQQFAKPAAQTQRTGTGLLGIKDSNARDSDRRNRGPLSITSNQKAITTAWPIDRGVSWISSLVGKTLPGNDLAGSHGELALFEGDRIRNDDYFPQGEDYEDEIGLDYGQLQKEFPNRRATRDEDMELQSMNRDATTQFTDQSARVVVVENPPPSAETPTVGSLI